MATHPFIRSGRRPLILGHRGLPARFQENSLSGFRECVALGIDGVELDVFLTRDRRVVVFHDEDTLRLTGKPGKISDWTYDELAKLRIQRTIDMGATAITYPQEEPIPLLEDVLDEFQDKLLLNIELKAFGVHLSRRHIGTHVGRILRERRAEQRVIVTSFDPFMLACLQQETPDVYFGFTWDDDMLKPLADARRWLHAQIPHASRDLKETFLRESLPSWAMERTMGRLLKTRVVDVEYTLIHGDTVRKAHDRNLALGAYTVFPLDTRFSQYVDSEAEQESKLIALADQGVDWIETDDAVRAMAVLQRERTQAREVEPEPAEALSQR